MSICFEEIWFFQRYAARKIWRSLRKFVKKYQYITLEQWGRNFFLCGRITPQSNPYVLRSIYSALTEDNSTSRTTEESEMDARISEALKMEDSEIIIDLRD